MTAQSRRSPIIYACAIGLAVWLGLQARRYSFNEPTPSADYAADVSWALTIFAAIGFFFPTIATWQAAAGAFLIPSLLEYGHWSHTPWLASIQGKPLGELVLGTEFVATDLTCYALGAGAGMLIELWTLD